MSVINDPTDELYDISTVSRLTGLSAANLRMWERRHEVVSPTRSESGRRQYTKRDLQRLTLLKTLSDRGHGIMSTAGLSTTELERRVEESKDILGEQKGSTTARSCRICIVGEHIAGLLADGEDLSVDHVEITKFDDVLEAEKARELPPSDLLLVGCPAFLPEELPRVERLLGRCGAYRAIVVYGFGRRETLERIEETSGAITAIRTPVSPRELALACLSDLAKARRSASRSLENAPQPREVDESTPPRRYGGEQLSAIARISSSVDCECPHHLSDLLVGLTGFEDYSEACENRNEADAEIHAYLHRMTAHARATVEDALAVLLDYEGIDIGSDRAE